MSVNANATIAFMWLAIMAGLLVHALLLSRLRRAHRATWESLGEPGLLWRASPRSGVRLAAFVWRSQYSDLSDPTLTAIAWAARVLQAVAVIAIGGALYLAGELGAGGS